MEEKNWLEQIEANMTAFLKKTIKEKGWMIKEVAERWGISPRRMSQLLSEPDQRFIDGVLGLPKKS